MAVGANLVFALGALSKDGWRREKGEHKVRPYNPSDPFFIGVADCFIVAFLI